MVQSEILRVRIRADAKISILKELSYLGITQSYVFPDLTSIAADAKMSYAAVVDHPVKGINRS
jgi:hypothetical protein